MTPRILIYIFCCLVTIVGLIGLTVNDILGQRENQVFLVTYRIALAFTIAFAVAMVIDYIRRIDRDA